MNPAHKLTLVARHLRITIEYLSLSLSLSVTAAPGPVAEVNVAVEDGNLTVEWNTPPYPNGILSGYMVSVETYPEGVVKFGPAPVDNSTFRHELTVSSLG